MDFGTLMMSQGMPSGIVPGMNNQMGIVPQQDANGLEFVNLLNLVEGMETSELSSASDGEQNFANAAVELKDEVGEKVSSDKNAALAGLAMAGIDLNAGLIGKSVGQDVPAKAELLETAKVPTNEIVAPQNIFLNAPAAKPLQADTRLDSESVAAWTAAFAANEVKDVQVSQAAPEGSDLSKQHLAASNESQMLRGSESPLELVKPESLKKEAVLVAAAPVVATSKSESVQSQSQPQVQAKSAIGPVAAREPAKEGFVSMTASVERVAANDSSIAPFAQREAVNAEK
ncbi:MAG: hypothetical protein ABIR96_04285, partial [Bdellovibrionota bacterium]